MVLPCTGHAQAPRIFPSITPRQSARPRPTAPGACRQICWRLPDGFDCWHRRDECGYDVAPTFVECLISWASRACLLKRPTERASQLCQGHVANVASGILEYLTAELPEFAPQAHFACFRLGVQPQPVLLRKLLTIMGWGRAKSSSCEDARDPKAGLRICCRSARH